MRPLRTLLIGTARAATWPGYIALAAYAARQAPWPRSLAVAAGAAVGMLALAVFAANLIRWVFGRRGWAEVSLQLPPQVARQARRTGLALLAAITVFLLPCWMLAGGFVAPGGRPVLTPSVGRGLILAFELSVLAVAVRVIRPRSPLFEWLTQFPERLGWLNRRRRVVSVTVLGVVCGVIVLDVRGYCFSAHRLSLGFAGSAAVAAICWVLRRLILRLIDRHAWRWRWVKARHAAAADDPDADVLPHDLAARLARIAGWLTLGVGLFLMSWVWDVDLALFQFMGGQQLWPVDSANGLFVTLGDMTKALVTLALTIVAWRHMSTCFALLVFPRMPDDPGVRFAVVTLCRYAVLGLGLLCGLSAVHLGLEKIGVVLAALGVGLGFGLQEIVSNFVCGIILLLERPIRVGDIVTVSNMSGKVDRIHIRATTIVNGDNQSIIVPNRAFITGDLVNWTLKDKIIRLTLRIKVAYGTDPDRVSELLLAIAREDADVLRNPLPSAFMEELSDSSLLFVLHAHVPDPSLGGRVRHRLFSQIQKRFESEGIQIPLPTQELLLKPFDTGAARSYFLSGDLHRVDGPSWSPSPHPRPAPPVEAVSYDEGRRGVDE